MTAEARATAAARALRTHQEVLRGHLTLAGREVADVGCGTGAMVRFMTREGARVVGIDCSAEMLEAARAEEPAGDEHYIDGRGEALPLADAALDAVVYFNALHHVPVERQGRALEEAARVLRPGGALYVVEPLAEGPYFELVRPIEDETEVRAAAYAALQAAAAGPALAQDRGDVYLAPVKYASFEAFKRHVLRVDPSRAAALERCEAEIARRFPEAAAEVRADGYVFHAPFRLNLLHRR